MMLSVPLPSFRLLGHGLGQAKNAKIRVTISSQMCKKFPISGEIRNFLVETAGLEPVTSCV